MAGALRQPDVSAFVTGSGFEAIGKVGRYWFTVNARRAAAPGAGGPGSGAAAGATNGVALPEDAEGASPQRQFFEFAGPLFGVRIAPSACTVAVGAARGLHALARDASRRRIAEGVEYAWRVLEGAGRIADASAEYATLHAPEEPGLTRIGVVARQGETACEAEALVTVTDSLLPAAGERGAAAQGLPGYTLEHAPGKLWRSRYDLERNLIVVNSGHRDLYAEEHLR